MEEENVVSTVAEKKKSSKGATVLGWIIIFSLFAGVYQCITGGNSSPASPSSQQDILHSPAARVSTASEAYQFVVNLRGQGVDKRGVATMNEALRAAGASEAASLIDAANRDLDD